MPIYLHPLQHFFVVYNIATNQIQNLNSQKYSKYTSHTGKLGCSFKETFKEMCKVEKQTFICMFSETLYKNVGL